MLKKSFIALVTVLAMAGCASKGAHNAQDNAIPTPVDNSSMGAGNNNDGTPTQIGDMNGNGQDVGLFDTSSKANVIYFTLDSSDLDSTGLAIVDKFARYLQANPTTKVRIEGNTDERGSREYNVGLGERRSNAVVSALRAKGVAAVQLSVISYGEERPAAQGHDEAAWAQNRRAVIVRQ
jgi:peptidoglycan-associated lipoprotein